MVWVGNEGVEITWDQENQRKHPPYIPYSIGNSSRVIFKTTDPKRNNCFSKIRLVGQKYLDKTTLANKRDLAAIVLVFKAGAFRY